MGVSRSVSRGTTTAVLDQAAKFLGQHEVKLMADSGVENINETVDRFSGNSVIERVLAQVEVCESNSMIEVFLRSLRHQWPYLHELDSIETFWAIVEFYVDQHNGVMPHAAFAGQTPDEVFFGTGAGVRKALAERRGLARSERLVENQSRSCAACTKTEGSNDPGPHEGAR